MSTTAIAASNAYRKKVALAAATGGALPKIAYLAFGTGDRPYTLDDTGLHQQFLVVAAQTVVSGVLVTAKSVLTGAQLGQRTLREVGVLAQDGTLLGRRVLLPKQLEPEAQIEFELTFQY